MQTLTIRKRGKRTLRKRGGIVATKEMGIVAIECVNTFERHC